MDNAQKAIMIGVGLFITIIIISAVLLIVNIGTDMMNSSREQLSGITKGLQNQVTSAYDGKTMNGSEVISAYQLYESSQMSVVVKVSDAKVAYTGKFQLTASDIKVGKTDTSAAPANTQSYPGGVYYSGDLTETYTKNTVSELRGTEYGVNAAKTYYSSVIKDAGTDTVIGILFVQK